MRYPLGSFSRKPVTRRAIATRAGTLALAGLGAAVLRTPPAIARQNAGATPAAGPSWAEVEAALAAVAPVANYLATEIVDGDLAPIAGLNAETANAVGSSFKLYILAELGRQVAAGTVGWHDPLEIRAEHKSIPGGDLRYVPEGTTFTVRYVAEKMIQNSDNTATDHLMALLGRENVEEMMALTGHAEPERNRPLLTTREFALLKFSYPQADLERYLAAGDAEQREILATDIAALDLDELIATLEQTEPREIGRVEWFASPADLARVMLTLDAYAEDFALRPLTEIMALETQLAFDPEVWPYVGFKGGSEMGVMHGTWLMRRPDDRTFVLSMGFNDPEAPLDVDAVIAVMQTAIDTMTAAQ